MGVAPSRPAADMGINLFSKIEVLIIINKKDTLAPEVT